MLFSDFQTDEVWLENVFDQQIELPALRATDYQPVKGSGEDAAIDLTPNIKKGNVTGYDQNIWVKSFTVSDASGNSADFHIKYKVVTIDASALLPLLSALDDPLEAKKMAELAASAASRGLFGSSSSSSSCVPGDAATADPSTAHEATWALVGLILLWLLLSTAVFSTISKICAALQVRHDAQSSGKTKRHMSSKVSFNVEIAISFFACCYVCSCRCWSYLERWRKIALASRRACTLFWRFKVWELSALMSASASPKPRFEACLLHGSLHSVSCDWSYFCFQF